MLYNTCCFCFNEISKLCHAVFNIHKKSTNNVQSKKLVVHLCFHKNIKK